VGCADLSTMCTGKAARGAAGRTGAGWKQARVGGGRRAPLLRRAPRADARQRRLSSSRPQQLRVGGGGPAGRGGRWAIVFPAQENARAARGGGRRSGGTHCAIRCCAPIHELGSAAQAQQQVAANARGERREATTENTCGVMARARSRCARSAQERRKPRNAGRLLLCMVGAAAGGGLHRAKFKKPRKRAKRHDSAPHPAGSGDGGRTRDGLREAARDRGAVKVGPGKTTRRRRRPAAAAKRMQAALAGARRRGRRERGRDTRNTLRHHRRRRRLGLRRQRRNRKGNAVAGKRPWRAQSQVLCCAARARARCRCPLSGRPHLWNGETLWTPNA